METKKCTKCNIDLPLSHFNKSTTKYKGKSYPGKLRSRCRNCERLAHAKWAGNTESVAAKIEREKYLKKHPEQKYCSKGDHFPLRTEFAMLKSQPDGLQKTCKDCRKSYRDANHPQILERKAAYRQANRERIRDAQREQRHRDKERISARLKRKRIEDPEYFRRAARRSYENNKERIKLNSKFQGIKRRARKANSPGFYSPADWQQKVAFHGHKCYLCGKAADSLEQDHRIPISRGGSNWLANVAPACKRCNRSKNAKTEREFRSGRQ